MSLSNELNTYNHLITKEEAVELTTRFRNAIPLMLKPGYPEDVLPISETFIKTIFTDISQQTRCVAIRSYLGMDEDNKVRLLFVGVDDDNNDILMLDNEQPAYIFEYGQRCPPICGSGPLNP
jgi:hypothetical protein